MIETYCECSHPFSGHEPGGRKCKCKDSYGVPCTCPYFDEENDDFGDENATADWYLYR